MKKLLWINQDTNMSGWLTDVSEISGDPDNGKMSWTIYAQCNKKKCPEAEHCKEIEKNGFCTNIIIDGHLITNEEIDMFFKLLKTLPQRSQPPFAFEFCYVYIQAYPEGDYREDVIDYFKKMSA
jgi:hypothetical protein